MMRHDGFGCLILTHGRPDKQITLKALKKQKYSGPYWLVCDDADSALPAYKRKYGEQVIVFSKEEIAESTDTCDCLPEKKYCPFCKECLP